MKLLQDITTRLLKGCVIAILPDGATWYKDHPESVHAYTDMYMHVLILDNLYTKPQLNKLQHKLQHKLQKMICLYGEHLVCNIQEMSGWVI